MSTIAILSLASLAALADSWPGPQIKEVFSESREWFVRVTPGTSVGETVGFAGAQKGKHATATFYRRAADRSYQLTREITIRNPVAPVTFFVTDRGYLVTLDNWHNMGYGTAVASYAPDGQVVFAAELKDLFSADEIERFSHSVSSIWWRTDTAYVRHDQQSVNISMKTPGSGLILEPESGRWQYCEWRSGKFQCRDSNSNRVWRGFQEPALKK